MLRSPVTGGSSGGPRTTLIPPGGGKRPLHTAAAGPATCTAREEELLTFLIREPKAAPELAAVTRPGVPGQSRSRARLPSAPSPSCQAVPVFRLAGSEIGCLLHRGAPVCWARLELTRWLALGTKPHKKAVRAKARPSGEPDSYPGGQHASCGVPGAV